jgi:hypothetical protein
VLILRWTVQWDYREDGLWLRKHGILPTDLDPESELDQRAAARLAPVGLPGFGKKLMKSPVIHRLVWKYVILANFSLLVIIASHGMLPRCVFSFCLVANIEFAETRRNTGSRGLLLW